MNFKLYQHYSLYGFSNSYILGNDDTGEALIVDPGEFTVGMLNHIEKNGYSLRAVLVTHSHAHHSRSLPAVLRVYDAALLAASSSVQGIQARVVRDGDRIDICGFGMVALSVPGHSPDSVVWQLPGLLFTGDALHAGMPGKTLSSFNAELLVDRISKRLLDLPDETLVFPGHGPPSSLGSERKYNMAFETGWVGKPHTNYDFFV